MPDPTKATGTARVSIQTLTPKKAQEILQSNSVNRGLRRDLVRAYRRDMEAGRWHFTAEPIQISMTGNLLNGQHRLSALAGSKKIRRGLDFVVAEGLPDESQAVMDQGAPRTIRDALMIRFGATKNINLVASISRWLVLAPELDETFNASNLRTKVTAAEAMDSFSKDPDGIIEAAFKTTQWKRFVPGSPTAIGYCWFQFHQIDEQAANEFFAGMADMNWTWPEDPRKAALRRLQIVVSDQDYHANLETATMIVSLLSRAWNAWRKQEKVQTILVRGRTGPIEAVRPV
jgi:hypothetical protein